MARFGFVKAATALAVAAGAVGAWVGSTPVRADEGLVGFHQVIDDTGTIAVAVPDDYTVNTTPVDWDGDGYLNPHISARQGDWILDYVALPHDPAFQPWDGTCTPNAECPALLSTEAYSDPEFTGYRQFVDGCCGTGLYETVEANANNGLFRAYVAFHYGFNRDAAQVAIFETALATFTSTGNPLPALPAPPTGDESVFPWGDFRDVPQLGTEPVRGSGCGSSGQIGDVIPDGVWAGFAGLSGSVLEIDLICVYTPAAAPGVISAGTANIINGDPSWLVVNNNERLRYVGLAPFVALRDGVATAGGGCVEGPATSDHTTTSDRPAWVSIDGGEVSWVFWGCAPFGPTSPGPGSGPLPPAYPDYSSGSGRVWTFGEFWNVPQLGTEPVRGSGCGSAGQIGPTIPDGLWSVFVDGYDTARGGFWVNLLCVFYGQSAQAVIAQGTANIIVNQPDWLVVNNNPQTRFVPDGLAAYIFGDNSSGACREGDHLSPEQIDLVAANRSRQAWIRIAGGAATWIFYGC